MAPFVFHDPPAMPAPKEKLLRIRWEIVRLEFQLAFIRLETLLRKANFNPSQPRVPSGNPDGGQWTRVAQAGSRGGRGASSVRVGSQTFEATPAQAARYAVADSQAQVQIARVQRIEPNWRPTPSLYDTVEGAILARRAEAEEAQARLAELARLPPQDLIAVYRRANNTRDLFGRETWPRDRDTVAVTWIERAPVAGASSGAPPYTATDRAEAQRRIDRLARKYPQDMGQGNPGQMPNNALYHAESNVLLRAARANGGSLAGRHLEVHVDRRMCPSCETVLPRLGLELGNPTVTFVDPFGARMTMQNGAWIAKR